MSFTYDLSINPQIFYVRLLVADTDPTQPIFGDDEILSAFTIQQSMFQSGMRWSGVQGSTTLPSGSGPVSYLRVAALLLDAIAASKSRLAVTKLLDGNVNFQAAAKALREQAQEYRDVEDNSGAFVIIEQCVNGWSFLDRFYKQVQRQTAQ